MQPQRTINRNGFPAEIRTRKVPAWFWSDGDFKQTTVLVKEIKNR